MVQTPADKVFAKVALFLDHYWSKRTSFHVIKYEPDTAIKVIDFLTLNEVIALQVLD